MSVLLFSLSRLTFQAFFLAFVAFEKSSEKNSGFKRIPHEDHNIMEKNSQF